MKYLVYLWIFKSHANQNASVCISQMFSIAFVCTLQSLIIMYKYFIWHTLVEYWLVILMCIVYRVSRLPTYWQYWWHWLSILSMWSVSRVFFSSLFSCLCVDGVPHIMSFVCFHAPFYIYFDGLEFNELFNITTTYTRTSILANKYISCMCACELMAFSSHVRFILLYETSNNPIKCKMLQYQFHRAILKRISRLQMWSIIRAAGQKVLFSYKATCADDAGRLYRQFSANNC